VAHAQRDRAQRDAERLRLPEVIALAATGLGYLSAADGDLETARRWPAQALDTARSSSDAPVIAQDEGSPLPRPAVSPASTRFGRTRRW
jgi:hypothetical protein